ncbi:MAG: hypothetical protein HY297_04515 [Thaumarchaeota archaeon]|nr:hypothetical protein [Nitrososphaerota archaeon]
MLAAFFGHMGYALLLIAPWGVQVYSLYSLANQIILGWALLLTGPSLLAGVGYVIARNPGWLGGAGSRALQVPRRETFLQRTRVPRRVTMGLTLVLILGFVGYLGAIAYALSTPNRVEGGRVVVEILETPFSWQYSPGEVTVQLGVNATVTWSSRSISFDTVTDRGGAFDSGHIAPGQTFTHSFGIAGTYDYYCSYHPWMTGTVRVLPSTP